MKYEIKELKQNTFKPFSVTLTFETEEEYIHFHDNVMGKITRKTQHKFHTDIFNAGNGSLDNLEGKI